MKNLKTQEEIIVNWKYDINKPVVSVLCTTYNHESYIEEALEGFLIQETDFPFEIIIHDDASTDNTANIIREYEAKYPKLIKPIYQTKNRFSQGLKNGEVIYPKAKGEYFALCEGDDFWIDKEKLQYQIEIMRAHSECQLSFHPAIFLDTLTMNKSVERRHAEHDKIFSAKEIIKGRGGFCPTPSLIIKKEVIQNLPIFIENAPVVDYYLQVLGSIRGGALYIDKTMSTYRIHPNGAWTSIENNFESLKKYSIEMHKTLQEMDDFLNFQYQEEINFVKNDIFLKLINNIKFPLRNRIDFYNSYKNNLSLEEQIKQQQVLFDEQTRVSIDNSNHHKRNTDIAQKKLDSLQHKYHADMDTTQNKLNTITNRYNLMMDVISNLIEVPAKTKPLQKAIAYKSLKKTYFELRKAENEKK